MVADDAVEEPAGATANPAPGEAIDDTQLVEDTPADEAAEQEPDAVAVEADAVEEQTVPEPPAANDNPQPQGAEQQPPEASSSRMTTSHDDNPPPSDPTTATGTDDAATAQ